MSYAETFTEAPVAPAAALPEVAAVSLVPIPAEREAVLRKLLDGPTNGNHVNYESAEVLGLIDLFYYDPVTGRDGLVHILSGEVLEGSDGARVAEGFHHEPSGAAGPSEFPSSVDREHLKRRNSKGRSDYRELAYEPYQAQVRVDGRAKLTVKQASSSGEQIVEATKNHMYPKEYDALNVMQAVRFAHEGRDRGKDIDRGDGTLKCEGFAPMIDGISLMKIRLIVDAKSDKVITAYPLRKTRGVMKLSAEAIARFDESGNI